MLHGVGNLAKLVSKKSRTIEKVVELDMGIGRNFSSGAKLTFCLTVIFQGQQSQRFAYFFPISCVLFTYFHFQGGFGSPLCPSLTTSTVLTAEQHMLLCST